MEAGAGISHQGQKGVKSKSAESAQNELTGLFRCRRGARVRIGVTCLMIVLVCLIVHKAARQICGGEGGWSWKGGGKLPVRRTHVGWGKLLGHYHLGNPRQLGQVGMWGLWTGHPLEVGRHFARFTEIVLIGHIFDPNKAKLGQLCESKKSVKKHQLCLKKQKQGLCCISQSAYEVNC